MKEFILWSVTYLANLKDCFSAQAKKGGKIFTMLQKERRDFISRDNNRLPTNCA